LKLLIDASNIKSGGGFTHLYELLSNLDRRKLYFDAVSVVGGNQLDKLKYLDWLEIIQPEKLKQGGFIKETYWKLFEMPTLASHYDLVFAPGGTFNSGNVRFVSMSQNMLVFQKEERGRYGSSFMKLRLVLLQMVQTRSFRNAAGIIFISDFAQNYIRQSIGNIKAMTTKITHGISSRFNGVVKVQKDIKSYSFESPFRFLYVSIIDVYKHQDKVISTVAKLNAAGYPVHLDLVGGAYPTELEKLNPLLDTYPTIVSYHGLQSYDSIEKFYQHADAFIFASSCENMPNILIEAMASGLPVASSDMGPMKEFLQDAGFYFDPLDVTSMYTTIVKMLENKEERSEKASRALALSGQYNWKKCADETAGFLNKISRQGS